MSSPLVDMPIIELSTFFEVLENKDQEQNAAATGRYYEQCKNVAKCLHNYGIVIIRDPRVSEANNDRFLDMMERYFESSDGIVDARPHFHYQVGVTPSHIEKPREHCGKMGAMTGDDKPLSPCPPEFDAKWRFFWRTGPVPQTTEFPVQNMDAVIPSGFPEWSEVMNMWGGKMTDALFTLAEMAAVGFDMPAKDAFTSRMLYGPHLLAPTGSDLNKFGALDSILAGFHYDLNFLTIHGKSRFPGLYVWTREGKKCRVAIPDGCLLVQAGKQIEYLTGGHVLAGFHEVVVNDSTVKVIESRRSLGQSLWRVSSTCFGHIQSDQVLQPLPPFENAAFPPVKAGHQVQNELKAISLDRS